MSKRFIDTVKPKYFNEDFEPRELTDEEKEELEYQSKLKYDMGELLTHGDALFYIATGARGVGKTYNFFMRAINRFLRTGEQFIYLRRYADDYKGKEQTDKIAERYPMHEIVRRGDRYYVDGHLAGYRMPLSGASKFKGSDFSKVWIIGYDEFSLLPHESHKYLKNEVTTIYEFIETVDRDRDKVKFVMMGNFTDLVGNPIFDEFEIYEYGKGIEKYAGGGVVIEWIENKEYEEMKSETRLGRLTARTSPQYYEYLIGRGSLQTSSGLIGGLAPDAKQVSRIIIGENDIYVWYSESEFMYYFSSRGNQSYRPYVIREQDLGPDRVMMPRGTNTLYSRLVSAYKRASVRFESQHIEVTMRRELFKRVW